MGTRYSQPSKFGYSNKLSITLGELIAIIWRLKILRSQGFEAVLMPTDCRTRVRSSIIFEELFDQQA